MILAMLWACMPDAADTVDPSLLVDVAPLSLSIQLDDVALDCESSVVGSFQLIESMGFVYVVNNGEGPVQIDVYATHTRDEVVGSWTKQDPPEPWMDVSVDGDEHRNLEPGGQMEIELFAMGRCYEDGKVFNRFTHYTFPVEILIAGEPTVIEGVIMLTPREP